MAKLDEKARRAKNALRGRNFSDAISFADEILTDDPDNASAKGVKQLAERGEKERRLKVTLFALGAAALAIFVLFGVFAKKIFKKEDSGQAAPAPVGAAVGKGVYVQVVDGVGRGKLARVQGEVFRIGASEGADDSERNDLVISDSLASVSRHHCSIIKKGRDYYLIDSSRNGTRLNTRVLARGDDRRLRDGDEISLADVSILKFVKT